MVKQQVMGLIEMMESLETNRDSFQAGILARVLRSFYQQTFKKDNQIGQVQGVTYDENSNTLSISCVTNKGNRPQNHGYNIALRVIRKGVVSIMIVAHKTAPDAKIDLEINVLVEDSRLEDYIVVTKATARLLNLAENVHGIIN